MIWVVAALAWLAAGLLVGLAVGAGASPRTALERKLDDEAQIRALREYRENERRSIEQQTDRPDHPPVRAKAPRPRPRVL